MRFHVADFGKTNVKLSFSFHADFVAFVVQQLFFLFNNINGVVCLLIRQLDFNNSNKKKNVSTPMVKKKYVSFFY